LLQHGLVGFWRLGVAEHGAGAEHDQGAANLHPAISAEWNEADLRVSVVRIQEGVLRREGLRHIARLLFIESKPFPQNRVLGKQGPEFSTKLSFPETNLSALG